MLIEPRPHHYSLHLAGGENSWARFSSTNCESEYLVFALDKETAAHALIGSNAWAFRRVKAKEPDNKRLVATRFLAVASKILFLL